MRGIVFGTIYVLIDFASFLYQKQKAELKKMIRLYYTGKVIVM